MRILHTADLHLGRSLHERDLIPDQKAMLDALLGLIVERKVDVLVMAGDIYDRSIPQPEAIALFDSFLSEAMALPDGLVVIVVPGNHDSAQRLSFGASLLRRAGLHIRTRAEDAVHPVVVEKGGERVVFWTLPYLGPASFQDRPGGGEAPAGPAPAGATASPGAARQADLFDSPAPGADPAAPATPGPRSQAELFAEAMRRMTPLLDPVSPNVLVAHCYAAGGSPSESERGFIGGAEEVPVSCFEPFDYVALGHLHRRQAAGAKARYPGTPIAYSFDEASASPDKGFLLIEPRQGGFSEEVLRHEPLHRLSRVEGRFADLIQPGAGAGYRDDFVELRLTDPSPILDPVDPLRANFPNLLSVRQAAFELAAAAEGGTGRAATAVAADPGQGLESVLADFRAFHQEIRKEAPDPQTEAIFAGLLKEADHATA
jgi:exonuclease SbcD